ncbi:Crp/Fnr family transcriptional regulator [Paenibacillus sp. FSL R10-2734]|uniref:Crp/Fnr family transcriptional regulator n=1 Tax=Paenibacillus sp. FSL R10-2734 TaxID=2954691 RepID=UPI0030D787F1
MSEYSCNHTTLGKVPCPSRVPIFQSLSCDEIMKISRMINHIQYRKGQMLFHEGEKSDKLFIVKRGQVKVSKYTSDGKEQILYLLTSGDFFGELHIFNPDELHNFSVQAINDTEICILTKQSMDQIMQDNPGIAMKLLTEVTKRMAHTENLAKNLATKDPDIRVAAIILEFCNKFGKSSNGGILVRLPITREEIANYVGVTRETISRKFSKFEKLGIISFSGNKLMLVKDQEALLVYTQ